MACNCNHANRQLKFPLFGPQPIGPHNRWPVYFVPLSDDPGFGHYFCPGCLDGLDEARVTAGLGPLQEEKHDSLFKVWYESTLRFWQAMWEAFSLRHPQRENSGS